MKMPGCDPMTGMNIPSGLKARTITCHANTSDTQSNDTRQTRTNIYPHGTPRLKWVHIHNFAIRLRAR